MFYERRKRLVLRREVNKWLHADRYQSADGSRGDRPMSIILFGTILWLSTLGHLLQRRDLDPVTKLTWVVVVIFVPLFGMVFYWFVSKSKAEFSPQKRRELDSSPALSGTPWENNPGYTLPKN
jgi:hypothetical protein